MISKGEQFPSFSLENQDGNFISNETIKGRKTILYFYPRDNLSLIHISEPTRPY